MAQAPRFQSAIAGSVACLIVALVFARLHIGAGFLDEAYYVAVGYRTALGDRLFIDELNLTQSFTLLTSPLIGIFERASGGLDGVFLFTRRVYFALSCLVALAVFGALKRWLVAPAALGISLACIVFVPFNIPNLSYNSLGSALFTLGCFLGLRVFASPAAGAGFAVWSGVAHGLAVVSHPSLGLGVAAAGLGFAALQYGRSPLPLALYVAAAVAVALAAAGAIGFEGLSRAYEFLERRGSGGEGFTLPGQLFEGSSLLLVGFALGAVVLARFGRPAWALAALILLPLLLLWEVSDAWLWDAPQLYILGWALCGGLFLLFDAARRDVRPLLLGAGLPSIVAGLSLGLTSSNGGLNAGIGLLPAALVSSVLLYRALEDTAKRIDLPVVRLAPLLGILLVSASLLSFQRGIYKGGSVLDARVLFTWGPYEGIYSIAARERFLRIVSGDLAPLLNGEGRILFYDHFPAGYLLSAMPPATPSIFKCYARLKRTDARACTRFYSEHASAADIAVYVPPWRTAGVLKRYTPDADLELHRAVERNLARVVFREDLRGRPLYAIYHGAVGESDPP